jgi:hypothetical protein
MDFQKLISTAQQNVQSGGKNVRNFFSFSSQEFHHKNIFFVGQILFDKICISKETAKRYKTSSWNSEIFRTTKT